MRHEPAIARECSVLCDKRGDVAWLTLNRPERHNSLVPEVTDALQETLAGLAAVPPAALVLSARGPSFSTGGDLSAFLLAAETSRDALRAFASHLVGGLHACLMRIIRLHVPVISMVQGPVTGGSAGFVFASDFVLMAEDAFLQPYYSQVGFAPDGGWTALLPDLIGAREAFAILAENRRIDAKKAVSLGLATVTAPAERLREHVDALLADLAGKQAASIHDSHRLIWDEDRCRHAEQRLHAEETRFVERILEPETTAAMKRFLASMRSGRHG